LAALQRHRGYTITALVEELIEHAEERVTNKAALPRVQGLLRCRPRISATESMKASFDSHERAFRRRQLAFQIVRTTEGTFELLRDGLQCGLFAHWCTWLFWLHVITELIGDDSSIRHRNIALASRPRADE
jgi:hypothetical protein